MTYDTQYPVRSIGATSRAFDDEAAAFPCAQTEIDAPRTETPSTMPAIATNERELTRLDELHRRGLENGVPGLRRLTGAELRQIEPHAEGIAALHSPETGIVDFGAVARALAADLDVATGCAVARFTETGANTGSLSVFEAKFLVRLMQANAKMFDKFGA